MFIYDLCYIHFNTILLEVRLTQVVRCTRYNVMFVIYFRPVVVLHLYLYQ